MDPVSIVGLVGTCISLVATTSKAIKALHDLKSGFEDVAVEITHLLSQVSTIQSSVHLIQQWLNLGPSALQSNAELRDTIEQALEDCIVIISAFEKHVARIRYSAGKVPVKGKIRHLFDQEELTKNQQAMGYQMQALTLLLQAIQMTSVVEQRQLMAQKETRIVLKWIRDDASSYIDPGLEQSSMLQGTIMSNDADPDALFDFDDLVLDSQAYRSAFRAFMKKDQASRSKQRDVELLQAREAPENPAGSKLDSLSPAICLPVTRLQILPQAEESEGPTETEVESRMLGNPKDSGHGFSEPPTGAGLGASNSIRPHSDNGATTATISTSVNSTDRGSASGAKETLSVSESSATVNSRSESENLGTNTKLFPISDPSKHLFLLSEAFPYIPDDLGRCRRPIGALRLLIIKASGLTNFNRAGNPNSFVTVNGKSISSGSHEECTLVAYDNPSPRYNEVLYIPIHDFQGKLTIKVVDYARGESTDQSLGTVIIDPLEYISQSQEGEYVSHRRTDRRQLHLSGRLCGTLEFEVSFYPCVRLVTESGDIPKVQEELMAAPRLPSKVFLGFNESLSYKSGVLFFKLDWGSTPPEDAALYVEDLMYPYYRFNPRQGFTSGTFYIGSCFVRDVRVGQIFIRNLDDMHSWNIADLLTSDYMSAKDPTNYCKTIEIPNVAPDNKTFELRLSSFFFPISLPIEEFSDAGILRIDVVCCHDLRSRLGRRYKLHCALFVNEREAYSTQVHEKGPHTEWTETFHLEISSRTADTVKMRVLEDSKWFSQPYRLSGEKVIRISDLTPFRPESYGFDVKGLPAAVVFRVLFQPSGSWDKVSDDQKLPG